MINEALDKHKQFISGPEESDLYKDVVTKWQAYDKAVRESLKINEEGKKAEAIKYVLKEARKDAAALEDAISKLATFNYNGAIKSTEKGVIKILIYQSSENYNIKITDTGIGMSATMSNYLITGKSKDDVENLPKYKLGNGVGYQIIRNIVKKMSGLQ
jgi:light-regulated signal transduction histidine kinase (bacteriophytochrome)